MHGGQPAGLNTPGWGAAKGTGKMGGGIPDAKGMFMLTANIFLGVLGGLGLVRATCNSLGPSPSCTATPRHVRTSCSTTHRILQ